MSSENMARRRLKYHSMFNGMTHYSSAIILFIQVNFKVISLTIARLANTDLKLGFHWNIYS